MAKHSATSSPKSSHPKSSTPKHPAHSQEGSAKQATSKAVEQMIRVDHAGEYGAVRLYEGQLAVLGKSTHADALKEMLEHEQEHLATFRKLLKQRNLKPTVFQPLWHVAGFALGAATAALGTRTAMACTVAVEDEIDEHYESQEKELGSDEKELKGKITQFRAEEQEHRDEALRREAEKAPLYPLLYGSIRGGTRLAIWLSTRW